MKPTQLEAQAAVLGSMVLSQECIAEVADKLNVDMFSTVGLKYIWKALLSLDDKQIKIDLLILKNELGDKLSEIGGIDYVIKVVETVPHAASVDYYSDIVLEYYRKAEIAKLGPQIDRIATSDVGVEVMYSEIAKAVETATVASDKKVVEHVGDVAKGIKFEEGGSNRIPTGYQAIDNIIVGLVESDLLILAGRPGMGKTALMADIASSMSWTRKIPTAFYSCEMRPEQIVRRMASARCRVPLYSVEKGYASQDQRDMLYEAAKQMQDCPMYIKAAGGLTPSILKRRIMQDKRRYGIKAVFVDYLQLLRPDGGSRGQYEDLTSISRAMKQVVISTGVPMILGSQLKRTEDAKKPSLSDLRGSGAIEEDADIVLAIHRPSYWTPTQPDSEAYGYILKGRHFGTGVAPLQFTGNLTHFEIE